MHLHENYKKVMVWFMLLWSDGMTVTEALLQTPASSGSIGIYKLHNDLLLIFVLVLAFVGWMIMRTVVGFKTKEHVEYGINSRARRGFSVHGVLIEVIWTILPGLLLALIAVPSFAVLYGLDVVNGDAIGVTVHVIGRQWYWSYEVSGEVMLGIDTGSYATAFDSYMVSEGMLSLGELRLLEVDSRLVLPVGVGIRFLVSGGDVLHSFAVPSFGIKLDGCPGRINEVVTEVLRMGTFYGQCSELCGVGHAFMPIAVDVVDMGSYIEWLLSMNAFNTAAS